MRVSRTAFHTVSSGPVTRHPDFTAQGVEYTTLSAPSKSLIHQGQLIVYYIPSKKATATPPGIDPSSEIKLAIPTKVIDHSHVQPLDSPD